MSGDTLYRPTGLMESYHIARQNLKMDACVIVAGRFVSTTTSTSNSEACLTRENVLPALAHAVHTHAALSVRIVPRGKNEQEGYFFKRIEKIDLESSVKFLESENGQEEEDLGVLMEREFTDPITSDLISGSNKPVWRVIVSPNNLVIFAWHHCIGDGQSGLAFLRTLLSGLNIKHPQYTGVDFRAFETNPELKLFPPIEELTDLRVSILTLILALVSLVIPSSWRNRNVWTGNDVLASAGVFRTRARMVSISPPVVTRILTAARAHKTTLTAVFYLLTVNVISSLITSNKNHKKYSRLSIKVPVSFRPLANIPPTAMGEFVSTYTSSEPLRPFTTFPWSRATIYAKQLREGIPGTREIVGTLKYLYGKYEDFHKGKLGKKREVSFELSNVGAFKVETPSDGGVESIGSDWTIEEVYFGQDDGIAGAALKINTVGAPSGAVNISVTWGEDAVDDEFAEAFVRDLRAAIEKLDEELISAEKA